MSSVFTVVSWQSHIESVLLYNIALSESIKKVPKKLIVVRLLLDGVFGGLICFQNLFILEKSLIILKLAHTNYFYFYKEYLYFELKGICSKIPPCAPYLMNIVLD